MDLAQLDDLGHLGELCRLASVFGGGRNLRLTEREYTELSRRTAGLTFRYPRPAATLQFALKIGLVQRKGGRFTLSSVGARFETLGDNRHAVLSRQQGRLLLSLLVDDLAARSLIAAAFRNLSRHSSGRMAIRAESIKDEPGMLLAVRVLQQCQTLEFIDGDFFLVQGADEGLPPDLFLPKGMTAEDLLRRLDEQRRRGHAAELFVVDLEKRRLTEEGRPDLAEWVLPISSDDVGAGYDIRSFDADGATRYVEVKSSIGRILRFEWSVSERRTAEKARNAYWVYFVPLADDLITRPLPVLAIQNPIEHVTAGRLQETPTHFVVDAVPPFVTSPSGGWPILRFETSTDRRLE